MGDRLYVFDTDLFLYSTENFELGDVLVPVLFLPAFGNDFFGAGYNFAIDMRGAYMCYFMNSFRLASLPGKKKRW